MTLSKFNIFKKKIIKYKLINIIKPPTTDIARSCFFNFPSGLSKKIKKFENFWNLKKMIEFKKNINNNKK